MGDENMFAADESDEENRENDQKKKSPTENMPPNGNTQIQALS